MEKKSVVSPARGAKMSAKDKAAADKKAADAQAESDDALCFICASDVEYWAVGECNHRTCHTCSIRLRALCESLPRWGRPGSLADLCDCIDKRTDCTFCKVAAAGGVLLGGTRS